MSFPPETFDLAVVALSARALARSARCAGLRTLALDLFADADTREHAALAVKVPSCRGALGFDRRALLGSLERHAPEGLPVVLGAGFEHAPDLMRAIARRNPILGASPDVVARLKNPTVFAALLHELQIPHPQILTPDGRAALHLSPAGRGRREASGEGASTFPEKTDPPHPLGFADRPLPRPSRVFPTWTLSQSEIGNSRFHGERWAESAATDGKRAGVLWLSKRAGASGGEHISNGQRRGARRYLQQRIEGRSVSALFLADGAKAQILGFSEQWPDVTHAAPFRYGGAVGPVPVADAISRAIADGLDRLVAAVGLTGLASADIIFPASGPAFVLLEINPRPGATLDVFDRAPWPSLLALHIDACEGRLPGPLPPLAGAFAAAVVHARARTPVEGLDRPHWTADWPSCDETVHAGAPFCTVFAAAQDHRGARRLVEQRRDALLARLPSARVPAPTNQR